MVYHCKAYASNCPISGHDVSYHFVRESRLLNQPPDCLVLCGVRTVRTADPLIRDKHTLLAAQLDFLSVCLTLGHSNRGQFGQSVHRSTV